MNINLSAGLLSNYSPFVEAHKRLKAYDFGGVDEENI